MTRKSDPWIKRAESKKKVGYNIATIMRNRKAVGDIGIEIEVEGNKFPKHTYEGRPAVDPEFIPDEWVYHKDGSLRGDDNAEYIFKKPLKFSEVEGAIKNLWEMFEKYGSVLADSNRTSVHVHLNAQKWCLNRVCAFAAIYFSLEELLTEWCGDHRVGNLFCLRAKDAPGLVSKLKTFLQDEGTGCLTDGLHYAGLNVQALCKFGSIEIRSLRGCSDPKTILDWVSILQRIYEVSEDYPDPRMVCDGFSGEGPMAYLHRILGDKAPLIIEGVGWDNQKIMASLYEGIRLAQDLCYCRDWSEYEPVVAEPDPFRRTIATPVTPDAQGWADAYQELLSSNAVAPTALYASAQVSVPTDPIFVPGPDSSEVDWIDVWHDEDEDED